MPWGGRERLIKLLNHGIRDIEPIIRNKNTDFIFRLVYQQRPLCRLCAVKLSGLCPYPVHFIAQIQNRPQLIMSTKLPKTFVRISTLL